MPLSVALVLATVMLQPTPSGAAAATPDHVVVMGAVDPALADTTPRPPAGATRLDRFEYLAYYPDVLRVHRGDTVLFRRDGFHTVTFSPAGAPRGGFFRRDEMEGVAAEDSQEPSDPTCGTPAKPCRLRGDRFLNSGWRDLTVAIDAPVGTYTYYCMLHEGMGGALDVVPRTEPVTTTARAAAQRRRAVAADTARGATLLAAGQTPRFQTAGDHVKWFVKAGDITADGRVSVLRFLPSSLAIAPGDEVEYVVPGGPGRRGSAPRRTRSAPGAAGSESATDLHTVTFPDDAAARTLGLLRYFDVACDPDGATTGLPGQRGMYAALVAGCPAGTTLELLAQPWAWSAPTRAPADAVLSQATVHDSGFMTRDGVACRSTCDPWTRQPFPSASRTVFPVEGSFGYVCLVHPEWGMAGSITVARSTA